MEPRWKESLDQRMEPVTLAEEARERILLQGNQTKGASKMKSRRRVILVAAVLLPCVPERQPPPALWI